MKNQTVVIQFDNGDTRALTRIPMEKTSNGMKFVRWQLPLRQLFAGTVPRSLKMTLQRAVIDCRNKFWEHDQLYVALSRVRSPADLCILLPSDSDDFGIHPPVDRDVVQILETMNASRPSTITPIVPGNDIQAELAFIEPYDALSIRQLSCFDDYIDASEDDVDFVPSFEPDRYEIVDQHSVEIPLNVQIISRILEDQQELRFNVSEICYSKSRFLEFLCLFPRFCIGSFKPVAENSAGIG
jgi:hypothetical protein